MEEVVDVKKLLFWLLENILLPAVFSAATTLVILKLFGQF
jgi:hypothetical protein